MNEATAIAKILIHAAEAVGAKRSQSIRSAIYGAAERLQFQYETDYEQWVHRCHALILTLYEHGIHNSFAYSGGRGRGFWLNPVQRGYMQDALLFAYEFCVTDLGAERDPFFEIPRGCEWCGKELLPSEDEHCGECLEGSCD